MNKTTNFHCYNFEKLMNSNDPFYTLYEFNNIPLTESEETSKLYVLAHSQKDAMELA